MNWWAIFDCPYGTDDTIHTRGNEYETEQHTIIACYDLLILSLHYS